MFNPPVMPPYPSSLAEFERTLIPYMKEKRPIELFFEFYILKVLGVLPAESDDAVRAFVERHPFFGTGADWCAGVRQQLHLSDTIDIAILDLWYINRKKAIAQNWVYHPWHYAMNFIENYFKDGSRVDVWEGDALTLAKQRIEAERLAH